MERVYIIDSSSTDKIRNNHPRVWKEFKIDVRFTVDEQNKK